MRRGCFCPAEHCCCSQFGSSGRAGPCRLPGLAWPTPLTFPSPWDTRALGSTLGPALGLWHPAFTQPPHMAVLPHRAPCLPLSDETSPLLAIPLGEAAVWHPVEWKGSGGPSVLFSLTLRLSPITWVPWPLCPPSVSVLIPVLRIFFLSCLPC